VASIAFLLDGIGSSLATSTELARSFRPIGSGKVFVPHSLANRHHKGPAGRRSKAGPMRLHAPDALRRAGIASSATFPGERTFASSTRPKRTCSTPRCATSKPGWKATSSVCGPSPTRSPRLTPGMHWGCIQQGGRPHA